ncbi:bifunctional metallophosphatase/5'-nucleotidase [Algiphilus sp. W345]|uniref:Bifunctional metallophosphatase/5'-nucleotidase n=1 Tax=Banduia mediterranea TaxID=3075609 RepID=A0ABU2WH17_9GAMM|nr:bifunctional metallophosphatase/5'-nucleotidase [Algiphilus sp. W345]MDT0497166.1 bifunctional metallophosphatase/5'-nucleotidase [Algiphilus sp. W345]
MNPSTLLPYRAGLVFTAFATLLLAACASTPPAPTQTATIKLIAFNDFHGNLAPPGRGLEVPDPADASATLRLPTGGVAYLAGAVSELRAQNPLNVVVAAGDLISASPPTAALFRQEPSIEALNALGLEYSAVGNHEFDQGIDELRRLQNGGCGGPGAPGTESCVKGPFTGARFRYLGANVTEQASDTPAFPPYLIKRFQVDGRSIGVAFIGEVLKGTPAMVTASGIAGLEFHDEADTANALVPEIRAQGVEAIVLLLHEGGYKQGGFDACEGLSGPAVGILQRLDPAIDVVISGHTHQAYNCRVDGRLLTSAASYGRVISDIDLLVDRASGEVISASARNLPVINQPVPEAPQWPAFTPDPVVTAIAAQYEALAAPLANRVVGRADGMVSRQVNAHGESALGDVIADAQLAATRMQGAQIALMNPGGIRADLGYGPYSAQGTPITWGEVFTAQPFGNNLVTMTLSGAQIHRLLESQWNLGAESALLQVSAGFSYAWDGRRPIGQRIDADSISLDGNTIEPDQSYRVTVNNFLAGGGDGFEMLTAGADVTVAGSDLDAMLDWLATASPLAASSHGRIHRLDAP